MQISPDVINSISENIVDISSAWGWIDVFTYSPRYTEILTQPISLEATTLDFCHFKEPICTITIRETSDPNSTILWSGISYNIADEGNDVNDQPQPLNYSTGCVGGVEPAAVYGVGTISISSTFANLCSDDRFQTPIQTYYVTGNTFTLTDGLEQYLVIDYNNGTPIYRIENNKYAINDSNIILVRVVWRCANNVHSIDSDCLGLGLSNKLEAALISTTPYKISNDGGMSLSESSTPAVRTVLVTSAVVFGGSTSHIISAFNSSVNKYTVATVVNSAWTYTSGTTQYNNTQYNGYSGLSAIGNNNYSVVWMYRSIGNDIEVFQVLGTADYSTIAKAQQERPRSDLSIMLRDHCMLVGRIIVQKNATSGLVENVSDTVFYSGVVSNHNDLQNIQGGATGEYYHLSAVDYTNLTTGFTSYVRSKFVGTSGINYTSATGTIALTTIGTSGIYTKVVTDVYGRVTSGGSLIASDIPSLATTYQIISEKNQALGYAGLDVGKKIYTSALPDTIVGQLHYLGTWNATTNTPTLPNPNIVSGGYYIVSVSGTSAISNISPNSTNGDWKVGDWIVSDGIYWDKIDNTDAISSWNGRVGAITPIKSDYSTWFVDLAGSYSNPTWITSLDPTKISQTSSYRFVTDAEKSLWNSKQSGSTILDSVSTLTTGTGFLKLSTGVATLDTNNYTPYVLVTSSVDFNTINSLVNYDGIINVFGSSYNNGPSGIAGGGGGGTLFVGYGANAGSWQTQLFVNGQQDKLQFRVQGNNTWAGGWHTVWHDGNLTNLNQLTNGPGYITSTALSTWAGSTNITTVGTLTAGTVPWARLSNIPFNFGNYNGAPTTYEGFWPINVTKNDGNWSILWQKDNTEVYLNAKTQIMFQTNTGAGTGGDRTTRLMITPATAAFNLSGGYNSLTVNGATVYNTSNLTQASLGGPFLPLSGGTMTGTLFPNVTSTIDFGSTSLRWNKVWCASLDVFGVGLFGSNIQAKGVYSTTTMTVDGIFTAAGSTSINGSGAIFEQGIALSSKYATISTLGNYLPISGGTLTGKLTINSTYNNHLSIGSTSQSGGLTLIDGAGSPNAYFGFRGATDTSTLLIQQAAGSASIVLATRVSGTIANRLVINSTGGTDIVGVTTIAGSLLNLTNLTSNVITFNNVGVAAPTYTSRSLGTKLVLYPGITASSVDYGFGVEGNALWSSVYNASSNFKWYAGTTNIATLGGNGDFAIVGSFIRNGNTVWDAGNLTNLNQLTNGPGYITTTSLSGYLPLSAGSGKSLTSDLYSSSSINLNGATRPSWGGAQTVAMMIGGTASIVGASYSGGTALSFGINSYYDGSTYKAIETKIGNGYPSLLQMDVTGTLSLYVSQVDPIANTAWTPVSVWSVTKSGLMSTNVIKSGANGFFRDQVGGGNYTCLYSNAVGTLSASNYSFASNGTDTWLNGSGAVRMSINGAENVSFTTSAINSHVSIYATDDNTYSIGTSAYKWKNIYGSNGIFGTNNNAIAATSQISTSYGFFGSVNGTTYSNTVGNVYATSDIYTCLGTGTDTKQHFIFNGVDLVNFGRTAGNEYITLGTTNTSTVVGGGLTVNNGTTSLNALFTGTVTITAAYTLSYADAGKTIIMDGANVRMPNAGLGAGFWCIIVCTTAYGRNIDTVTTGITWWYNGASGTGTQTPKGSKLLTYSGTAWALG